MTGLKAPLGLAISILLTVAGLPALGGDSDRTDRWELTIPISFVDGEELVGGGGSTVDLSSDAGFGLNFGYNFDEKWSLGFGANYMDVSFDARIAQDDDSDMNPDQFTRVAGSLDSVNFQLFGRYNFLRKSVTPFVRAGVGWTHADSNIPSGPPTGLCWWHPFWGYTCDVWQPTKDENAFSYGAGAGIRAELTELLYLEGTVSQLWIDFDEADDTPDFSIIQVGVGWLF